MRGRHQTVRPSTTGNMRRATRYQNSSNYQLLHQLHNNSNTQRRTTKRSTQRRNLNNQRFRKTHNARRRHRSRSRLTNSIIDNTTSYRQRHSRHLRQLTSYHSFTPIMPINSVPNIRRRRRTQNRFSRASRTRVRRITNRLMRVPTSHRNRRLGATNNGRPDRPRHRGEAIIAWRRKHLTKRLGTNLRHKRNQNCRRTMAKDCNRKGFD